MPSLVLDLKSKAFSRVPGTSKLPQSAPGPRDLWDVHQTQPPFTSSQPTLVHTIILSPLNLSLVSWLASLLWHHLRSPATPQIPFSLQQAHHPFKTQVKYGQEGSSSFSSSSLLFPHQYFNAVSWFTFPRSDMPALSPRTRTLMGLDSPLLAPSKTWD